MNAQNAGLENRYVIVAGVDFSDASAAALREAVRLASRMPHPELHVVHVFAVPQPSMTLGAVVAPELAYLQQIDDGATLLGQWLEPYQGGSLRLAGHVRVGAPAREIAQVASDVGAGLIVVGTNSRRGLDRFLVGSVAEALVRRAPCAVLAFRPREKPAWELIEPPCPDCVQTQTRTNRASLWCARHSEHHVHAHTYYEYPATFGVGAQTLRG